jgi:hypothetical protein
VQTNPDPAAPLLFFRGTYTSLCDGEFCDWGRGWAR